MNLTTKWHVYSLDMTRVPSITTPMLKSASGQTAPLFPPDGFDSEVAARSAIFDAGYAGHFVILAVHTVSK